MSGSFIDTNVLVYVASGNLVKADQVEKTIADGDAVSVQVLNELASVLRRKMHMPWPGTHALLSLVRALLPVQSITLDPRDRPRARRALG